MNGVGVCLITRNPCIEELSNKTAAADMKLIRQTEATGIAVLLSLVKI
jgi:hypothetical protein